MYLLIFFSLSIGIGKHHIVIFFNVWYVMILITVFVESTSAVVLSPSGNVSVCPGSQPSFRCSTNLRFLEWNITTYQSGMSHSRRHAFTSISQPNVQLTVNGNLFNITRISAAGSVQIISTVTTTVNKIVADTINGTRIRCTGREVGSSPTDNSTSVATVHVITPNIGMSIFNVCNNNY